MKTYSKILFFLFNGFGLIVLTLLSCDGGNQIDYNLKTNFVYKNTVSENIEIILFDENNVSFKSYLIEPSKEIIVSLTQEGGKTGLGQPFAFENNAKNIAKKVVVKFIVSNKCLSFSEMEGMLNVKKYDSFSEIMYNTSNNTLIYNIDQTELDLAIPCP